MKAITIALVAALGSSLAGCAPAVALIPLAGAVIIESTTSAGPHASTVPAQPAQQDALAALPTEP